MINFRFILIALANYDIKESSNKQTNKQKNGSCVTLKGYNAYLERGIVLVVKSESLFLIRRRSRVAYLAE